MGVRSELHARLPQSLERKLAKRAKESGLSKNAHICLAVEAYLKGMEA